ncbi:hypothetical protein PTKU46_97860 [Paraburkholderia terrae]
MPDIRGYDGANVGKAPIGRNRSRGIGAPATVSGMGQETRAVLMMEDEAIRLVPRQEHSHDSRQPEYQSIAPAHD